jgi:hypothetical protein
MGRKFIWWLDKILRADPALGWMHMALKAGWTIIPGKRSDALAKTEAEKAAREQNANAQPLSKTGTMSGSIASTGPG